MSEQKRVLYHFPMSPFSRRTRLALAHKSLPCELVDARASAAAIEEARRRVPLRTIPVLVEPDGRALADSTAISHYLDRAYAGAPALWPLSTDDAHAVFEIASLVDVALNGVVDLGTRYYALRANEAWPGIRDEGMARVQRALDSLAEHAHRRAGRTVARSGWSAADIWLFTMTVWMEGMPARAATTPNIAQIMSLGFTLPPALSRWADAHREREDVRALG